MTALYAVIPPSKSESRETAHRLLALAVFDVWGWTAIPALERGPHGKPFFAGHPNRWFNLSHTGGLCLCALSDAGPVGVDCEMVRPRRPGLPRYVMSDGEYAAFDGSWEQFYQVWTMKEAYCKYLGRSIIPPRDIPAPPPVPYRTYAGAAWRAALCGEGAQLTQLRWADESVLPRAY